MNVFLDENFPGKAREFLESRGFKVFDIRGTNQEGMKDADLFKLSQHHQAVFLTTDKDFFHTIPFLFPKHHGIVVVALKRPNAKSILHRLHEAWPIFAKEGMSNTIVLLTDTKAYLRKE